MSEKKRTINSLQGLRGIAILCIFASHFPFVRNATGGNALGWAGALGVELFIMLSGYLFALQNDSIIQNVSAKYLKKKIGKFYPLHLLTLICAIPFSVDLLFVQKHINTWLKLGLNTFLMQSWVPIYGVYFSFNTVSWYLSMNAFFIIAAPFILKFIKRFSIKKWMCVVPVVILFQIMWCNIMSQTSIAHWAIYILPVIRLLDFILGCGVYYFSKEIKQRIGNYTEAKISILAVISAVTNIVLLFSSANSQSEIYSVCVWVLPCMALLLSLALAETYTVSIIKLVFENRFAIFIGNISFELFLVHLLVIQYGQKFASKFGCHENLLLGIVLLLLSVMISWFVQLTFNCTGKFYNRKNN